MTAKNAALDDRIYDYILRNTLREDPMLAKLREETARHPRAEMQIGPEQGQFMALLARAIGARRYLEVGVFTGYSSLVMAQAMGPDGYVLACDVSEEYTAVARRYWQAAGVASRIELRIAPAIDTLSRVRADGVAPFDIAFVDADKQNTGAYYEACLQLVRPGGLLLFDNVLWSGAVADESVRDVETEALRAVARKARDDERVECSLVPICDGILIARKRE